MISMNVKEEIRALPMPIVRTRLAPILAVATVATTCLATNVNVRSFSFFLYTLSALKVLPCNVMTCNAVFLNICMSDL